MHALRAGLRLPLRESSETTFWTELDQTPRFGREECALCEITYSPVGKRRAWTACAKRLGLVVDELHRDSLEFARFWDEHAVLGREGGERSFNHPKDGFLRYEQVTFNLAGVADFRLTMLLEIG